MSELVTILSCLDLSMACLARTKLEQAGIPCFLCDTYTVGIHPLYANALGGIRIQVPACARQRALKLLSEDLPFAFPEEEHTAQADKNHEQLREDPQAPELDDFLPDNLCPACGSSETESRNLKRFIAMTSSPCCCPSSSPCGVKTAAAPAATSGRARAKTL